MIASLILAKTIRALLPFRLRPIHDAAIGFVPPYHVTSEALWNWSYFPNTAGFAFALSVGLLVIWPRWGVARHRVLPCIEPGSTC
jgi:hypothetical protein